MSVQSSKSIKPRLFFNCLKENNPEFEEEIRRVQRQFRSLSRLGFCMTTISRRIAIAATFSAISLVGFETSEVVAKTITYDFTAVITRDITGGSLLGQSFKGSFSYEDSMLSRIGRERLRGATGAINGVRVSFNFLGVTYTEAVQKGDYPVVELQFVDGKVDSFKYYFWDRQNHTWFLLGGNHNTNVAPGPGVGQISYILHLSTSK